MIQVDAAVTTKFAQSTSIETAIGATMDINCNSLVSFSDDDFTGANYAVTPSGKQAFKSLFPLDSIVKAYRPEKCGIRYAIDGDLDIAGTYTNPRDYVYKPASGVTYRTYLPSKNITYKYYVTPKNTNASFAVRYYDNTAPISYYNKAVPCNKIVLKFELAHSTPSSWAILINGSDVTSGLSKTIPSNGVVEIYYTGTAWSRSESALNYNAQVTVNTLGVTAVNPGGDKHVGIIELAPHWVKDLTSRIVGFNINKEASSDTRDIIPVGLVTANSLDIALNAYESGTANILFKKYNKEETVAIDTSYIYMVKHAEIKPYFKVYDAAGTLTDSKGTYFKVPQGYFYLDSWNISEFGDVSALALDQAKVLQETICPDIICDKYSLIAILRRVLDSVGFTNYNFNIKVGNDANKIEDTSIITPIYWWSDSTKTVWAVIQELCRDSQMSAVFDENNILQFYSRDYVFNRTGLSANLTFRNTADGNNLPNIVSLNMNTVPSANQVKVLYSTAYVAAYEQNSKEIMDIDQTWLTSAALQADLPNSADPAVSAGPHYMKLDPISIRPAEITAQETFQSFSGYILINAEIVEYDAIKFQYQRADNNTIVDVDITGPNDYAKYRGEAKVLGNEKGVAFWPTQFYRIKTRAALGTQKPQDAAGHKQTSVGEGSGWLGYKGVVWK